MHCRRALVVVVIAGSACGSPPAPQPPAPPPASAGPSCAATADHVATLVKDRSGKLREAFAVRCDQDRWSVATRACITSTTSLDHPKRCKDTLTPPQREALDRDLELATKPAPPQTTAPPWCVTYGEVIAKAAACDQLPEATRDALRQGYDAMTSSWTGAEPYSPEAFAAANDACQQATEALNQALGAMCGW